MIDAIKKQKELVLVDVGARGGVYQRWKKLDCPFHAILFEPEVEAYHALKSSLPSNYTVLNSALLDRDGFVDLNVCRSGGCSSIYKPNLDFLRRYSDAGRFDVVRVDSVKVNTLDNEIRGHFDCIDFIKIDAQGAELPILKGSAESLKDVIGLEVECSFSPMYQEQPLFCDVNQFLHPKGFELIEIRSDYWGRDIKPTLRTNRKGQIVWCDALFLRPPEYYFRSGQHITHDKMYRVLMVYVAYRCFGLAHSLVALAHESGLIDACLKDDLTDYLANVSKRSINTRLNHYFPDFKGKSRIANAINWLSKLTAPRSVFSVSHSNLGDE